MIVREVLQNPSLIDTLDIFNDGKNTLGWLVMMSHLMVGEGPTKDQMEEMINRLRSRIDQHMNPLLATFEKSPFKIGCLQIAEWCRYWEANNVQYIDDGVGIESTVRGELAEASALVRRMARLLDAADCLNDPARSDEQALWYKSRKEITGRPAPPEQSP